MYDRLHSTIFDRKQDGIVSSTPARRHLRCLSPSVLSVLSYSLMVQPFTLTEVFLLWTEKTFIFLDRLSVETDKYAILWRTNEKENKNRTPNKHLLKLWIIKNTKTGWPKCSHYHSPIFLPSHPLLHWHFRFRYLLVHSLLRTVSTRENRPNTGNQRKENKRSTRQITQWFYATGYTHNITVGKLYGSETADRRGKKGTILPLTMRTAVQEERLITQNTKPIPTNDRSKLNTFYQLHVY